LKVVLMRLTAFFENSPRIGGLWCIEAFLIEDIKDEHHSERICFGLSADWASMFFANREEFDRKLLAGELLASVAEHPWGAGNDWYITPLFEGVVIEHQWQQEYQRENVGWYSWDLVRAVVLLTRWCESMKQNEFGLDPKTLNSARFSIEVQNWMPAKTLASLGWKSSQDG
jgi:hypothetical protein